MFDRDTGQVFQEYVAPPRPPTYKAGRDWSRRTDLPEWKGRSGRGVKGPRALTEMAMHVIAENIGFLSEEHLSHTELPVRYLRRMWTLLENRGICLQAWKTFSKILLAEDDGEKTFNLYKFRQHICRPSEDLRHYTVPLDSSSLDFLSHLNIGGFCTFDTNELLSLADLRNLAVLEIIQPSDELRAAFPRVSDRLIRSWSEKPAPFPVLRVLRLWGDGSVTPDSLRHLARFPSLRLYDVNGARAEWLGVDEAALAHGWHVAEPMSGQQDSLLWYLMLFHPLDEQPARLRDMARNIDEGLLNLCQSGSQAIELVPPASAPAFMDRIADSARSNLPLYLDAPANGLADCRSFPFETWGFSLATLLGQLSHDADLESNGAVVDKAAVAGKLPLPSRPVACLQLGHCGRAGISPAVAYVRRGLFATARYTLYRAPDGGGAEKGAGHHQGAADFMKTSARDAKVETGLMLNRRKRRRMDDLLQSFTGS